MTMVPVKCFKCGEWIDPEKDAVFHSKRYNIYCGDCAAKYNIDMFSELKRIINNENV